MRRITRALGVAMAVMLIAGGGTNACFAYAAAEDATGAPPQEENIQETEEEATTENQDFPAPDFTLEDQYGQSHTLSEYEGKVVFLNLWTTWCPWCVKEMQDIEDLYHELGENQEEVVLLGLASPSGADTADKAGIISFLEEHGWSYPVLMDEGGTAFQTYITEGYPTTWLIRKDGMIMGYITGALTRDQMMQLIRMTLEYTEE